MTNSHVPFFRQSVDHQREEARLDAESTELAMMKSCVKHLVAQNEELTRRLQVLESNRRKDGMDQEVELSSSTPNGSLQDDPKRRPKDPQRRLPKDPQRRLPKDPQRRLQSSTKRSTSQREVEPQKVREVRHLFKPPARIQLVLQKSQWSLWF